MSRDSSSIPEALLVPIAHVLQRFSTTERGSLLRSSCLLLSEVAETESLGDSVGVFPLVTWACPNLHGKGQHFCLIPDLRDTLLTIADLNVHSYVNCVLNTRQGPENQRPVLSQMNVSKEM